MSLFNELKRRNVIRVAIAYLALAWLVTEVAGTLFPAFGIPDWGIRFLVIVFALGFVPTLIISWAYEITPEGLKREKDVVRDTSITHLTAKRLDVFTIGLIVVAIVFIWADRFWLSPSNSGQIAAPAEVVTDTAQTEPQYPHNSIAVLPIVNMSEDTGPPQPMPVARVQFPFPEGEAPQWDVGTVFAMSPDGTRLVYVGPAGSGNRQLWLRSLDAPNATPIPGTDGARTPFFSPDGQFVAFLDGRTGALWTVSTSGSSPIMLVEHTGSTAGDWGPDEMVYFGSVGGGISRVSASGGEAEVVTRPDTSRGELEHSTVDVLPNGKGALITIWHGERGDAEIAVVEFNTGAVRVLGLGSHPLYAQSGHVVYVRDDGVLLAAPFDQNTLEFGVPTSLTETVYHKGSGQCEFSVSETGTLLLIDRWSPMSQPVWVDRDGGETTIDPDWKGEFLFPALSPEGTRLALSVGSGSTGGRYIWIKTLAGGPPSQLTFEGSYNQPPVWSLDGQRVMYHSSTIDGVRGFREQQADGSDKATLVLPLEELGQSMGWSNDGRWLVYQRRETGGRDPAWDIFGYQPDLGSPPVPLVATGFSERNPALSPDGRWLAYDSDRSGRFEVYVKPFPNVDDPERKVSTDGGVEPSWAHNRQELFYKNGDNELVVVEYETAPSFRTLTENSLFSLEGFFLVDVFNHSYAVDVDDDRFLMLKAITNPYSMLWMTFNFFEELKQRVEGGE